MSDQHTIEIGDLRSGATARFHRLDSTWSLQTPGCRTTGHGLAHYQAATNAQGLGDYMHDLGGHASEVENEQEKA